MDGRGNRKQSYQEIRQIKDSKNGVCFFLKSGRALPISDLHI